MKKGIKKKMRTFMCDNCYEKCCVTIQFGANPPRRCHHDDNKSNWLEVKETGTDCNQLPKLTAEVFDRPDCPEWANYAAVDKDGGLYFYGNEPSLETSAGEWCYYHSDDKWGRFDDNFDASDWQNSLIERPAKVLPDWCKVEKWGYDTEDHEYFEIVDITPVFINVRLLNGGYLQRSYNAIKKCCVEAKKRAFNDKEMKALVGKVIESPDIVLLVNSYGKLTGDIGTYCGTYTAELLMDDGFVIDGKPCFKLEHLNEKGEWVE